MKTLWLGAAAAAALAGASLAGCASPHYPLSENVAPGPAPLAVSRPQYPIDEARAKTAQAAPTPPTDAPKDEDSLGPTVATPTPAVDSQPLPPPRQSADAGAGRFEYASFSTQGDTASSSTTSTAAVPVHSSDTSTLTPHALLHDTGASSQPPPRPTQTSTTEAERPIATPPVQTAQPVAAPAPPPPKPTVIATRTAPRQPDMPGMVITGDVVKASGVFENYEVQKGDHVDQLARQFDTSRSELVDANHLKSPFTIRPGQIIKVPVAKAYVVKSGDSLRGVAKRFSVSLDELADLNHISSRAELRAGQQIGLPSSMRDKGPLHDYDLEVAYATPRTTYHYNPPPPREGTPEGHIVEVPPQGGVMPHPAVEAPTVSEADIAKAGQGRFIWPVRGGIVGHFGPMGVGRRNEGVDIAAAQDAGVKAAAQGSVLYAGELKDYGNVVLLQHDDGWVTVYAHLAKVEVRTQDQVSQGQEVGLVGLDADSGQPALHFEIRYHPVPGVKTQAIDPQLVLPTG